MNESRRDRAGRRVGARRRWRKVWLTALVTVFALERLAGLAAPAFHTYLVVPPPPAPAAPSPYEVFAVLRPVAFTMTVNWSKVAVSATAEQLKSNPYFWRNMHFDDWDRLPSDIRTVALERMTARYRHAGAGPGYWAQLDASHWDMLPQPLRAVIFPQMVRYWADTYGVTRIYQLDRELVIATLNAVMMAESWFEHRAINVNQWGNQDLGLGQCSNRCRRILAEMGAAGDLDFILDDEDYFNPWHATRALVVWFGLELIRADGDLNLAIRAYHRGFAPAAASEAEGAEYLANVLRLRSRYFGDELPSPTWEALRVWAAKASRPEAALPLSDLDGV